MDRRWNVFILYGSTTIYLSFLAENVSKQVHQNQAVKGVKAIKLYKKGGTRLACGEGDITQKMLTGMGWANVFNNYENKKYLVKLEYFLFSNIWV